ncbi:hypothetical protein ACOMHN_018135 [Nucella lapillus]
MRSCPTSQSPPEVEQLSMELKAYARDKDLDTVPAALPVLHIEIKSNVQRVMPTRKSGNLPDLVAELKEDLFSSGLTGNMASWRKRRNRPRLAWYWTLANIFTCASQDEVLSQLDDTMNKLQCIPSEHFSLLLM